MGVGKGISLRAALYSNRGGGGKTKGFVMIIDVLPRFTKQSVTSKNRGQQRNIM